MVEEVFDEVWDRKMDKFTENLRRNDQRVASLEQDARQPRLAMEADEPGDTKTRAHGGHRQSSSSEVRG